MTSPDIKFGTDGWRGIIAWDFNFDNVRKAAQAIADYVRAQFDTAQELSTHNVVVGFDRRFLSDQFAFSIAQILRSNKLDVILLEKPCTTPEISFLTTKKFWLGVMVTASHNPYQYNGIKIKIKGRSAPQTLTAEVEALLGKGTPLMITSMPVTRKDFHGEYLDFIHSLANTKAIGSALKGKIGLDYMYGSAAGILETMLPPQKLHVIHGEHDPLFPGINPEPIEQNLSALMETVKKEKLLCGIALDGDGDRIGFVDDKGNYISPCIINPLILKYLSENLKRTGKVVQCVSLGYLAKRIAREKNIPYEEVPVGFKNIADKMLSEEVLIGAEESGGYSWKGNPPERDGILTALMMLEIMAKTGKKPSELIAELEAKYGKSSFQRRDFKMTKTVADKNVYSEKLRKKLPKKIAGQAIAQTLTIDGLKVILDNDEWVLMRPSGTEPLLRIYAEAETPARTKALLDYAQKLNAAQIA